MLGVIGGSGLTQLASLELVERQRRRTPYGEPSAALSFGRISGCPVVFLARHGDDDLAPEPPPVSGAEGFGAQPT